MSGINIFFFIFLQVNLYGKVRPQRLAEGDNCALRFGEIGRCVHLPECPEATEQISNKRFPKICSFISSKPIICCKNVDITTAESYDSIAKEKCKEYNMRSLSTFGHRTFIVDGKPAIPHEFPHMAILGYGDEHDVEWHCGGSLISEKFVLTAAHCLRATFFGKVNYVMLGAHDLFLRDEDFQQSFKVKSMHQHPNYSPKTGYHDIALVELDRPASINPSVKPACLHTSKEIPNEILAAAGWGAIDLYDGFTRILQKTDLRHVPFDSCSNFYRRDRRLPDGINDTNQICADGGGKRRDTCYGDSGGPLQVRIHKDDYYEIIGITSLGHSCGLIPSVYTRVSSYIPWIESIVWPS